MQSVFDAQVVHRQPHNVVESSYTQKMPKECPIEPMNTREAVLSEDLGPILDRRIKELRAIAVNQHDGSQYDNGGIDILGNIARESGVSIRKISAIIRGERDVVNLDTADKLLMAVNGHISDVPVYNARELHNAALTRSSLCRTVARARGIHIPERASNGRRMVPSGFRPLLSQTGR